MKKIFIVEDDPGIRELLDFLLSSHGYEINTFPTATAFTRTITHEDPDLILMDVMLPDGNGQDLCRNLANTPEKNQIPVVLMSAHASIEIPMEGNAKDFIPKPFDIDNLLKRIEKQLQ